jgi:outer membrane protein TolC
MNGLVPAVFMASAEIEAAGGQPQAGRAELVPGGHARGGAVQRDGGPNGFTVSIGFRVPLQWGLRDAQAREANARAAAVRFRLDASLLDLQGQPEEALARLDAARRSEELLATSLTPQAEAAYRSSDRALSVGAR